MPDIAITQQVIDELRVEVAAKIRISQESGLPGAIAYVGLHPVVLGKLIDMAEKQLQTQEAK